MLDYPQTNGYWYPEEPDRWDVPRKKRTPEEPLSPRDLRERVSGVRKFHQERLITFINKALSSSVRSVDPGLHASIFIPNEFPMVTINEVEEIYRSKGWDVKFLPASRVMHFYVPKE